MTNQRTDAGYFRMMLLCCVIAFLGVAALSGCNPTKHQNRKERKAVAKLFKRMDKAESKYNDVSVIDTGVFAWITEKHPVKIGKSKPILIPGKKVTTVMRDTTISVKKDTVIKTVTVTKHTHSTDVVEHVTTVVDSNSIKQIIGRNRGLELEATSAKESERKAIESKGKWVKSTWYLGGLSLLLLLLIIGWVLRRR